MIRRVLHALTASVTGRLLVTALGEIADCERVIAEQAAEIEALKMEAAPVAASPDIAIGDTFARTSGNRKDIIAAVSQKIVARPQIPQVRITYSDGYSCDVSTTDLLDAAIWCRVCIANVDHVGSLGTSPPAKVSPDIAVGDGFRYVDSPDGVPGLDGRCASCLSRERMGTRVAAEGQHMICHACYYDDSVDADDIIARIRARAARVAS